MSLNTDVGRYLQMMKSLHGHKVHTDNTVMNNKALVYIDARPVFWTETIVKEAIRVLGPSWNVYIVETPSAYRSNREAFDDCKVNFVTLSMENIVRDDYSCILKTPDFWRLFSEEHLLIFQSDSLILRPFPPSLLEYDYMGAPCGDGIMNGGTSLRRRSAMIRVLEKYPEKFAEDPEEPEDITFCKVMKGDDTFVLPPIELCHQYFYESGPLPRNLDDLFAIHGTTKTWVGNYRAVLMNTRH